VKGLGFRGNRLEALDGHLLDLFRLFLHPIIAPDFLGNLPRWINSVQPSTRLKIRSTNPARASANPKTELYGVYLTESVYKVVLQKSIPAQIRQLILYYYQYKE